MISLRAGLLALPAKAVALATAVSLMLTGCSSGSDTEPSDAANNSVTNTTDRAALGQTAEFCDAIEASFQIDPTGTADDEVFDAALDLAPADLTGTVKGIRAANQGDPSDQDNDHLQTLFSWLSYNCDPTINPATEPKRRVAPPAAPTGFVSCGSRPGFLFGLDQTTEGSLVIYGDASLEDPFQGTVITVVTGHLIGPGDAPTTEVTIGGVPALTGPAGFFQGGGGPKLTRVVAWQLDGIDVTVIGRGFDEDQAQELVDLANEVEFIAEIASLSQTTLDVLYTGSDLPLMATVPFLPKDAKYSVSYRRSESLETIRVSGLQMTAAEFEAARAFLFNSEIQTFHGHDGFVAEAWAETGPFIATWHESDDFVVWTVGLGATKDETVKTAESSVELTPAQWKETTRYSSNCDD